MGAAVPAAVSTAGSIAGVAVCAPVSLVLPNVLAATRDGTTMAPSGR